MAVRFGKGAVVVLVLLEIAQFTFYNSQFGLYRSPVVLYITSVVLCGVAYWVTRHQPWPPLQPVALRERVWWPAVAALAGGLYVCLPLLKTQIAGNHPQAYSDIIPAITIYCQRLLAGEVVHRPINEELGYFLEPGYLPATWFPFVLPEYFRFDYRWMSTLLMLAGIIGYLVVVVRLHRHPLLTLLMSTLPFVFVYWLLSIHKTADIFLLTVEPLIVGYYLLLLAGLLLPSRPMLVAALIACLLSRYSLVFWVPLYLGLMYFGESRRAAWTVAGLAAAGVVLLYVVPVLSHDWGLFMRVQKVYTETTLGEWGHLNEHGLPTHLYNGIGLTSFVYGFGPGDALTRLKLAKLIHLGALFLIIGGATLVYWRQQEPRMNYKVFAVIVLKLYLTTFYALLQVPYAYLAVVGFFVSFYLVALVFGPRAAAMAISLELSAPSTALPNLSQ